MMSQLQLSIVTSTMREAYATITNSLTSTVSDKAVDSVMALVASDIIDNHG